MIKKFMRVFFRLLYHPLAFTYDLVAAIVSFGNWKDWVFRTLPFIEGTQILEMGHGPGHLQRALINHGLFPFAVDESAQMGALAKRLLGNSQKLTRGLSQTLPFQSKVFDSVVSTFPTEYIFDSRTLSEAKRILRNGGRLIVLPAAWPRSRLLSWLYAATGETPSELTESIKTKFKTPFINAGFETNIQIVEVKSSTLIIVIAKKLSR